MWLSLGTSGFMVMTAVITNYYGRSHIDWIVASFDEKRKRQYAHPLYDWFHETFPDMRKHRWIGDVINTGFVITSLTLPFYVGMSIYWILQNGYWEQLMMNIERYRYNFLLCTTSLLYIIRMPCCMFTIVPKCRVYSDDDTYQPYFTNRWLKLIHKAWFASVNGHGHDLIFSGHCCLVVNVLCHWTYWEILSVSTLIFLWLLGLFMSFWIIISRCHYYSDVFLAWCVSISVYVTCVVIHNKFKPQQLFVVGW